MIIPLSQAPAGQELVLAAVRDQGLARELGRLGLSPGVALTRMEDEGGLIRPVRIRGPRGEAVLSGNMASGLVVHLDDNRIVPLLEMEPRDKGHLEGVTCSPGSAMADTFKTLGLKENDTVEMLHRIPAMEYLVLVEGKKRISLSCGLAAKIWGRSQGRELQLAVAGAGKEFRVEQLLGGTPAQERIKGLGLTPGASLVLEEVRPAQAVRLAACDPVVVSTGGELRFILPPHAAAVMMVRPRQEDWA